MGISQTALPAMEHLSIQQPFHKISLSNSKDSIQTPSVVKSNSRDSQDGEEFEEEDEEGAFYRDLRRREEDRQRRLATRRIG